MNIMPCGSKYKTAQELWVAILKTFGGNEATKKTKKNLLKQQYGNFKVEGSENLEQMFNRLQKKLEPNSQNMAFISSAKHSRGNEEDNTASVSTASTNVPTASANIGNDKENHALIADEETSTEFALMAKTSSESEVFDNSLCFKACPEFKTESSNDYIESLKKELKLIKKEKDGLDSKLTSFQTASKDLDSLLESQRLDKNKEGLGYSVVPPPSAQIYSSPKKDMSWTGLPEFKDDTVTDYSRAAPTIENSPDDAQNRNPFVTETEASPSTISPKSFIKFVKENDSPTNSKTDKAETAKKSLVKYAEQYRKPTKKPNFRGNQKNWNNMKFHQFGPNFVMEKKACFNCGDFNHLAYDCRKRVKKGHLEKFPLVAQNFPLLIWERRETLLRPQRVGFRSLVRTQLTKGSSQNNIDDKVYWDSGCSRHMTGNISYLSDYEPFDGGYVSFGQGGCKITGKGTIKTSKLKFENVYFVKDLKYNLFSVSQICDNKNSDLFNDSECIMLGRDFKLLDDANTFFLKTKDETSGILRKFITEIKNLKDLKVKIIRCDNGGEFGNKEMNDFCSQKRIKREFSNARTPQQNGVAERRNRTLIEAARTTVLVNKSHNKTRYELFNGRNHAIGFLKPFGCHVMILNTLDNLRKFEAKGDGGYFIGYSMSSKAFKVFNKRTKRVEENLHIDFLENKAIEKVAGPNWLFDIDSLTKYMNYVPVVVAGINSSNFSGTKDAVGQEVKKDVSSLRYIALLNWVHDALLETSLSKPQENCSSDVPESSRNFNPTATSTNLPVDQVETLIVETPIPTVSSPVPIACFTDSQEPSSDTRLILKRVANQVESPSLDNILSLTNRFEDILVVTTNSYESNGVEADVRNMETTITASPTPTLRIHKDHPKSQIISPVDTPIQTRNKSKEISDALQDPSWVEAKQEELLQFKIQKVWSLVDCPKGVRPIGTKWVLKNKKDERGIVIKNKARLVAQGHTQEEGIDYDKVFAAVARIKAIRLFLAYASFMGFIVYQMDVKNAFLYGTIDEEVEFEALMHENFQMSAMGELNFFLGLQVLQKEDGIFISQDKYVGDILKKFGYLDVRSLNTPMGKENPWGKDGIRKDVDLHLYRSMIRSLMYLIASRPDIMFAVCACARHQVTPKECHLHVVKRIFLYLTAMFPLPVIETMEEGTKILVTIDGNLRTVTESSIRRNPKLNDETRLSSLPDAEPFENLTLMGYNISPNQKFTFQKGWFSHQWKYLIHTIMQCLSPKSTGFNEFSSNITTALVCLATNRTYNFSKIIFDGLVKNINNKISKFLMYPRFLTMCLRMGQFGQITHTHKYVVPFHTRKLFTTLWVNSLSFSGRIVPFFDSMLIPPGKGSGTPTEPHYTPSSEAPQTSHTPYSSPTLPPVTTALIPTVTPSDTPHLRSYTRRARIAQSSALPPVVNEPASPLRYVSQGEAYTINSGFVADQDKANIAKTSTLPSDSTPRVTSIAADEDSMQQKLDELMALCTSLQRQHSKMVLEITELKARVKFLEDKEGGGVVYSRDDALIKGRRLDEREATAKRCSSDTEEIKLDEREASAKRVTVATATISIPTGSRVVPTASPTIPTATLIFATATTVTPYTRRKEEMERKAQKMNAQIARDAEIAKIHAEEELQKMIKGLDKTNEIITKYLIKYDQAAAELSIGERIELINEMKRDFYMVVIKSNLGCKVKDFKGMTSKEIEAKFNTVWKQIKDFIPMGSKEEAVRFKRKGIRFKQEGVKKMKTLEEVPEEVKSTEEVLKEKVKEMIQLVFVEEVYVEAIQVKHPIVDWKVHTERHRSYWQIIRLGGSSTTCQFFVDMLKHLDREDLNQLWRLVKETLSIRPATNEKEMELWVELKRLYEPDADDQLWTHT
uniref:Uncharacterized protein n=1 Tax=Tanacetum cinerariifolium TaxID=118510 RepID=A0A6L2MZU4_TANCI|nr:hypothetical protein [Tanacetum cinerariifolium]